MKRRKLLNDAASSAPAASASAASEGGRTVALLRDIQGGRLRARTLSIDDRRLIVSYLVGDGYSTAEIAQMLGMSDRSVERDRQAIREGNALPKDPRLLEQMAGRLCSEAELCIQRIRRTARDRATPPAVKVDAEHRCYQILSDLVQRMQGLGYLPSAAQRIHAELSHDDVEVPSLEALHEEFRRLCVVATDAEGNLPPKVAELQAELQRAGLAMKLHGAETKVREIVAEAEAEE